MKNHIGEKYGRLTILEFAYKKHNHYYYICKCNCGNEKIIAYASMRCGDTKSCGCYSKELSRLRHPKVHKKKNNYNKRLNNIWRGIKQRCYNTRDIHYKNYGNRGIRVCNEWLDKKNGFLNFYQWAIQNGYSDRLSIDRIDVNGNYEPSNCRWATNKEQNNNRTNNVKVIHNGNTYLINDLVEISGIKRRTIEARIASGFCFEDIIYKGNLRYKNI